MARETVGEAYVRILAEGSGLDRSIRDELDDVDFDEHGHRASKDFHEGFADESNKSGVKEKLRKSISEPLARGNWLRDDFFKGSNWKSFRKDLETRFGKAGRVVGSRFENDLLQGMSFDELGKRLSNLTPHLVKARKDIANGLDDRPLTTFRRRLKQVDDGIDDFALHTGRAFGYGSRNNFLNFFGGIIKGGVGLLNIFPKMTKGFLSVKDTLGDLGNEFTNAGGGLDGLSAVGSKVGPVFLSGVVGIAALAGALVVLTVIIGPVVSLISGLVAAIVALAGSVTFAAAGALGALAGSLLPLVAGIGVAVLAFTNLSKSQKSLLSNGVKPLKKELSDLGRVAATTLTRHIASAARTAAPALSRLRPLVEGISQSLGGLADDAAKGLNSPAFNSFVAKMQTFLPRAVTQLGHIFGNTFGGVLGIFSSLTPITSRFLTWLERITGEFSKWANSAEGQRKLQDFFARAADSAQSVGRFIREAVVALGQLFSQGQSGGNTIFDDMADALHRFTDYLRKNPGAVAEWFANGVRVARDVGTAIKDVGDFFRKLDTPANRKLAHQLFTGLSTAIRITAFVLGLASAAVQSFTGQVGGLFAVAKRTSSFLVGAFVHAFGGIVSSVGDLMRLWAGMLRALSHVPGFGWARGAANAMDAAANKAQSLGNKLQGIKSPHPVNVSVKGNGGSIQGVINQVIALANHINSLRDRTVRVKYFQDHPGAAGVGGGTGSGGPKARGGMLNYAQRILGGEAGREAVVPLDRPLGQIDPSVRAIAAFAQGKLDKMGSGGIVGGGRSISADGWTIISNSEDSSAVAAETWARLVGATMS